MAKLYEATPDIRLFLIRARLFDVEKPGVYDFDACVFDHAFGTCQARQWQSTYLVVT